MCGIAGYFGFDGAPGDAGVIDRMTAALEHRGPDGAGHQVFGSGAFGHRRLKILDLSDHAHQPMTTPDGRLTITYNGEIYNFREIRQDLEDLGHRFTSTGDTEVLLKAFWEWGEDAVARLNGMFAFAIWDARDRRLTVARDRYGIKPVYLAATGTAFAFASEVKALMAGGFVAPGIDRLVLHEYMTFQNVFTDRTFFPGVRVLPPASILTLEAGEREPRIRRYWDYHFCDALAGRDHRSLVDEHLGLFEQAVKRQLVSDVDVGAYLSGGMDSGAITAIAARMIPNIRSFTCGFDLSSASGIELSFDERPAAEYLSYILKTEHYEMVLKAGDMERVLPDLVWHVEQPRVGQCYPNYYAAKLASRFGPVVLSGIGSDELFGGYPWRYYRVAASRSFAEFVDGYYAYWQRLVPDHAAEAFFAPIRSDIRQQSTLEIFRNVFPDRPEPPRTRADFVNYSLDFEARTFLHGLLMIEDQISMSHSLETRVPFLDNDLVDFAMKVPVAEKLRDLEAVPRINENETGSKTAKYFQKTNDGKIILREMLRPFVPDQVVEREKQGFSAPDASWFKGESIDYVRTSLCGTNARIYDYFDRKTTMDLLDDHLSGRQNRRLLIWSLLNVEQWLARFAA